MPERTASAGPQIVLGIDFGLRRIGLAVGDTLTRTARPLAALTVANAGQLSAPEWLHLERVIRECGASQIVVGCPYNVDGSAHSLTDAARTFARELQQRVTLPLHLEDERYSSSRPRSSCANGARVADNAVASSGARSTVPPRRSYSSDG